MRLPPLHCADCDRFDTAPDLDLAYAKGLLEAFRNGVEVLCYACDIDLQTLRISRRIPWTGAAGAPGAAP